MQQLLNKIQSTNLPGRTENYFSILFPNLTISSAFKTRTA